MVFLKSLQHKGIDEKIAGIINCQVNLDINTHLRWRNRFSGGDRSYRYYYTKYNKAIIFEFPPASSQL
ncbi:hypothetical protein FBB35_04220 [Nostoc sp. TCL240-02]|nr:hypothetical protein FBB35_04220 [Nostoc sp. TCL240-02]